MAMNIWLKKPFSLRRPIQAYVLRRKFVRGQHEEITMKFLAFSPPSR